jgi:hypothetical protein
MHPPLGKRNQQPRTRQPQRVDQSQGQRRPLFKSRGRGRRPLQCRATTAGRLQLPPRDWLRNRRRLSPSLRAKTPPPCESSRPIECSQRPCDRSCKHTRWRRRTERLLLQRARFVRIPTGTVTWGHACPSTVPELFINNVDCGQRAQCQVVDHECSTSLAPAGAIIYLA